MPASRLAILPGAPDSGLMMQTEALARLIVAFLDDPLPADSTNA